MDKTWSTETLINVAQVHDRSAQMNREENCEEWYETHRKIAFQARKWARQKVNSNGE